MLPNNCNGARIITLDDYSSEYSSETYIQSSKATDEYIQSLVSALETAVELIDFTAESVEPFADDDY